MNDNAKKSAKVALFASLIAMPKSIQSCYNGTYIENSNMSDKNQNKTKVLRLILFAGLVVTIIAPLGLIDVFAYHDRDVRDFEWHIWSRDAVDEHRQHLNCGSGSESDKCALKISIDPSVSRTGLTQETINSEVDAIEDVFDGLDKNMSIDMVSSADSRIQAKSLEMLAIGFTDYNLHCTSWFIWCFKHDEHFETVQVYLDTITEWGTSEVCEGHLPTTHDVRKTLTHELYHAMGIDHNPDSTSIVYYMYECGNNGYTPSGVDINDLEARYP